MTDRGTTFFIIFLVSLLVKTTVPITLVEECSSFCTCDSWYGLQRASCTGRHLYSIHTGAPNNVQALDLSDNVISLLNSFELMDEGFTNLKYLNLSRNAISEIGLNAFGGLTELRVLDLSKNRLHDILDDVFEENTNLRIVKLSNNNFNSHVPKLRSSSIMELWLNSCQISHIPQDSFDGLTQIRRLNISSNLMIQMSSTVVQPLHFLKKLSFEGNPWSCNRAMQDLQTYLRNKNVEFDEICNGKVYPQKFEKMIIGPMTKPRNYHRTVIETIPAKETKHVNSNVVITENFSTCEKITNKTINCSPIFWLLIGFLVGCSSVLLVWHVWKLVGISCDFTYRPRRMPIFSSYLQARTDSNGNLLASCPGTPPPPYREVMLRPNIYRYPSTVSNLNNNDTERREAYT